MVTYYELSPWTLLSGYADTLRPYFSADHINKLLTRIRIGNGRMYRPEDLLPDVSSCNFLWSIIVSCAGEWLGNNPGYGYVTDRRSAHKFVSALYEEMFGKLLIEYEEYTYQDIY